MNADERAPMCYFLLYTDINYFLNSEHSSICGSAFKSRAYKMAKKASKKLKGKTSSYFFRTTSLMPKIHDSELAKGADTKTCIWTALNMCKEEFPKEPCHKPPAKWPKKYNKIKQRKTLVVHFLNEKPEFLEKVSINLIELLLLQIIFRTTQIEHVAIVSHIISCWMEFILVPKKTKTPKNVKQ